MEMDKEERTMVRTDRKINREMRWNWMKRK